VVTSRAVFRTNARVQMKNEAKYSSKFVGPCFDMGSRPNYNYNEYHGGTVLAPF